MVNAFGLPCPLPLIKTAGRPTEGLIRDRILGNPKDTDRPHILPGRSMTGLPIMAGLDLLNLRCALHLIRELRGFRALQTQRQRLCPTDTLSTHLAKLTSLPMTPTATEPPPATSSPLPPSLGPSAGLGTCRDGTGQYGPNKFRAGMHRIRSECEDSVRQQAAAYWSCSDRHEQVYTLRHCSPSSAEQR